MRRGEYRTALQTLDFLVIHVDSDVSQEIGFDVPWNDSNGALPIETLVQNVVARLVELIGKKTYEAHAQRFIFAIAVHSTECWLMPLVFHDKKGEKITGCLEAINYELRAVRSEKPLSLADGSGKEPKAYRQLSRDYRKPKVLREGAAKNPSLMLFVRQLERLVPSAEAV